MTTNVGTAVCNGGAEAFVELQKALNVVGDYRLSTSVNPLRWAVPPATAAITMPVGGSATLATSLPELDYATSLVSYNAKGNPTYQIVEYPGTNSTTPKGSCFVGNVGSSCYASAIDLETSNGIEISGLNAEEQVIHLLTI